MTEGCSSPAGKGDPELARICELREAMALSPRELITKLQSSSDEIGLADHAGDGEAEGNLPQSFAAVPALANLASIVTSLQGSPLPPLPTEPEFVLPDHAPPSPLPPPSEPCAAPSGDETLPSQLAWQRPASSGHSRLVRHKVYAAGLGLSIGLALVAAGLWRLAGSVGSSHRSNVRAIVPMGDKPANLEEGGAQSSAVAKPELAPGEASISPPSEASGTLDKPVPATALRSSAELLVQEVRQRIERGDVTGARDLLANADADPSGLVLFTLAETYDPNMLAAWGMRGIGSDIAKARALYAKALSFGYATARSRLEALQ
jgi:hypothetical protein